MGVGDLQMMWVTHVSISARLANLQTLSVLCEWPGQRNKIVQVVKSPPRVLIAFVLPLCRVEVEVVEGTFVLFVGASSCGGGGWLATQE